MTEDLSEEGERRRVIAEALTWVGTPFRHCADVKGGGVDCAMLLRRTFIDALGMDIADPRPYPPRWHLYQDGERFLAGILAHAKEVETPRPGDVLIYRFGRCFSHGALFLGDRKIVHAYWKNGKALITDTFEIELAERPVRFFDMWARRRERAA